MLVKFEQIVWYKILSFLTKNGKALSMFDKGQSVDAILEDVPVTETTAWC